ncbi:hypothetical protein [Sinimarinibacterium sp. NLF-5-8]|uniref:hypothetical protein n=1 Tax=Sinimarinibacterium sp. NLF-5-8 TaxID=2698684 RepID=UPI00137BDF13|nr:hypothetical protein [Sinimarinibacterium sp. NLF-5-8]QHS09052.1 hypothetical protein GT972_02090 [Sinimarinibacterium sp. NLF-5-8]
MQDKSLNASPVLREFTCVVFERSEGDFFFVCQAEDHAHAIEQSENAYSREHGYRTILCWQGGVLH